MSEHLLDVKDLSVEYRSGGKIFKAVNGISFSLDKGEVLGLVGETGAGKTTTALSILKLLPKRTGFITGGTIQFAEENLTEFDDDSMRLIRGGRISMIFQDPMTSLNPVMSVGSQIAEMVATHSQKTKAEINDRVDEILKLVGIQPERKNEYPHQFSGGMKQRVVIAIALACQPELIIADEPTTALDVTIQAQILQMINRLKEQNDTSLLLITHDLGVVAEMCDKVAIMYAGEIVEYGTLDEVYNAKEHHPYTVGLFGAIPDLSKTTNRLKSIPGLMPEPSALPTGCHFHPRCEHCMDICREVSPSVYQNGTHRIKCHLFGGEGNA